MFVVAAAISLARDHQAIATFPDFVQVPPYLDKNVPHNYQMVFSKLNTATPRRKVQFSYTEPRYSFDPIPYQPNMEISGYFQSEKYFINHKDHIINLFSPSKEIIKYLYNKYKNIIDNPNTVSIHFRSYLKEDPQQKFHITCDQNYYIEAINLFPKDSLFVIFSNDITLCKSIFADVSQNVIYIEGENYIYDFYLMSLCKHNIICNSSFSWWAAYINKNPEKIIVAPLPWFNPKTNISAKDLLPKNWIIIEN